VAIEIELRAFRGTPVGSDLRKFADDECFNVGARGFFVVEIRTNIADMGISEANDLSGVAGVRENFLVTGEAGIENDFAAATRDSAGSATVKYAPVFEREDGGSVQDFRQWVLRPASFFIGLGRRQGAEMVHGPVGKNSASINVLTGDRSKDA
jgi:hypothetical protein